MKTPPPPLLISPNSKKQRVLMDPDVIEIPPPPPSLFSRSHTTKQPKNKQVIHHEVIDVDEYEDFGDVMIVEKKFDKTNKGKAIKDNSDNRSQAEDAVSRHLLGPASGAYNIINVDGLSSDLLDDGDACLDFYSDDFMDFDEYEYLQSHFDNVDIPPGVEASIPWLPYPNSSMKNTANGINSVTTSNQMQSGVSESSKPAHWRKKLSMGSSFHDPVDSTVHAFGANMLSPWSVSTTTRSKKQPQPNLSKHGGSASYFPSSQSEKKSVTLSGSTNNGYAKQFDKIMPSHGVPVQWQYATSNTTNQVFTDAFYTSSSFTGGLDHSPVTGPSMSSYTSKLKPSFVDHTSYSKVYDPFHDLHNLPEDGATELPKNVNKDEILQKFQLFKQFDTVEDHSDHHYASMGSSTKQPPKNWAKKIQEEWRILENDLPDSIFVRVYESRMDLLRAVIVGAEGTPYHDGLFFFDVFFPTGYPKVPPHVHYHSGGLRLNPNLYNCGKVCLSLLGTWQGNKNEKWLPGVSTVLQVLVSIQALILNQKPYFNEPGYARLNGSERGEKEAQKYNENTFFLSLKTMVYTMKRPPKHFEDFVVGHFHKRANDILVACKAYMDGAQVGCLVKGGVQDVDEGDQSCSKSFKDSLPSYVDLLVKQFLQIGVQDTEKFLTLVNREKKQSSTRPKAATGMSSW